MVCQRGNYNLSKAAKARDIAKGIYQGLPGGVNADGAAAVFGYVSTAGGQSLGLRVWKG